MSRSNLTHTILQWVPSSFCIAYGALMASFYSTYLDRNLVLYPLDRSGPPEDIIGFGFLTTWLPFAIVWALAMVATYRILTRKWLIASLVFFAVVTIFDAWLASVLARQVIAG